MIQKSVQNFVYFIYYPYLYNMKDNKKYCVWTLINSEGKFIKTSFKKKGRSWIIDNVQWVDNRVHASYHNYASMTNTIEEIKALGYDVNGVSVVDPH